MMGSGPTTLTFEDSNAADSALAQWRRDMPPVPSAYVSTEIMPPAALGWLLLGTIAAIPAVVLTAVALNAFAALAGWLMGLFFQYVGSLIRMGGWAPIVAYCWVIGGYAGGFVFLGQVAAAAAKISSRRGKNRNVRVALFFAMLAAVAGVAAFRAVLPLLNEYVDYGPLKAVFSFALAPGWLPSAAWAGGLVISLFVAVLWGRDELAKLKFCEPCGEFMTQRSLKRITRDGAIVAAQHMKDSNASGVAEVVSSQRGRTGWLDLFSCPVCGRGYLELEVQFKGEWVEGNQKSSREDSWRTGSCAVSKEDVSVLKPLSRTFDDEIRDVRTAQ
jgi:hypothetical protein